MDDMMADLDFDRIEVYVPEGQHLHLRASDLTVPRLSRVFKVISKLASAVQFLWGR